MNKERGRRISRSRFAVERPRSRGCVRKSTVGSTLGLAPVRWTQRYAVNPNLPCHRSDAYLASARRTRFVSSGVKLVSPAAMCPVSRAVTSWNTQPLPSGSLNEAYEA